MLLRFSVSNHLSVLESQELSLVTSSLKDGDEGLIDSAAAPNGSVLPAVVIYGANASGKSNVVDALSKMQALVLGSHTRGSPAEKIPRSPFRLDSTSSSKSSCYVIDFVIDDIRHHYGFEVSDTVIETEWLYTFPHSRQQMLFERQGLSFRFGRKLKGKNKNISSLTRPNSLYVSAAAQNNHQQLSKIFEYFRSMRVVREIVITDANTRAILNQYVGNKEELDWRVIDFLREIDTGVTGFRHRETEIPQDVQIFGDTLHSLIVNLADQTDKLERNVSEKYVDIELGHQGSNGKKFFLELDSESAGTRRLLVVLSLAFRALDRGTMLCIDELDASLHTQASEAVLKLFCSRMINRYGAQLVTTTHDTNLMRSDVLRRDQLWFTEKNAVGATQLYPLTDIRSRRSDNIEKGYLDGRFGAAPSGDPIYSLVDKT